MKHHHTIDSTIDFTPYFENVGKFVSTVTYSISGTLITVDWLTVLDNHAAAFGVMLGAVTCFANVYYQRKNHQLIASTRDRRKE